MLCCWNFTSTKKTTYFFPLAIQHLSEKKLAELKQGFDKIESEKKRGLYE